MASVTGKPKHPGGPLAGLPWRGPGDGRPDLPLPPGPMPLVSHGLLRKRWRYVGFYGDEVMLCFASVEIGPMKHCFWSLYDREEGRVLEHTQLRPGTSEVSMDGVHVGLDAGSANGPVRVSLELGTCEPIESICPSGRGWGWTRKRAGVPMTGQVEAFGRTWILDGFGVDDESAGYQQHHTIWSWSAGVGVDTQGRSLGWNLTSGINDPPRGSERAVWVDGVPHEPDPVVFEELDAVEFAGRDRLEFSFIDNAERRRNDNFGLIRSKYIHRFGTFSGSLDGVEIAEATGVMEHHAAAW